MINRLNPYRFCALCIVLSSCAVPKSGAVDEISSNDIPFGLNSPETSAPATTTSVVLTSPLTGSTFEQADLYFVDGSSLERVRLEIPSPTDLQGVFTALVAGLPDPAHTKVKTLLPVDFVAVIEVEGGVANVNGFYCYNSWFNCIDGFNNEFEIIMKDINDEVVMVYHYNLNDGNPNVNDVKTNLNNLLVNKVVVSYDKQRNKFIFKRILPVSSENYSMYIKIINSEDFLGFYKSDRNVEILLPYLQNIYSNNIVNILGDECIIIKVNGDCILAGNTVDNFGTETYEPSNIIFMMPINVPSNGLLEYNNEDGGDSFQYRLANVEQITWFTLTVLNQDNELIPNFSDYILMLQFIRHKTEEGKLEILSSLP